MTAVWSLPDGSTIPANEKIQVARIAGEVRVFWDGFHKKQKFSVPVTEEALRQHAVREND